MSDIEKIKSALNAFAEDRDWDQFHTPKNLAMALTAEVGELIEHFQWDTPAQICKYDAAKKSMIADEMADVLSYLVRLSDKLEIDLVESFWNKIEKNKEKYPVDKAKGTAKKYTEL